MPDGNKIDNRQRATEIVSAYLQSHQVPADQIAGLIKSVHESLERIGRPLESIHERGPAVPIRRSVHRDYVVCLECGWRGVMLRRHVTSAHGLSVDEYRARWKLPRDHLLTAPGYSERRSGLAKQFGLGRGGRGASAKTMAVPETKAAAAGQAKPKRRGRPRSKPMPPAPT